MSSTKNTWLVPILAVAILIPVFAQKGVNPFAGRWDINITTSKESYPDWMELADESGTLAVRIQPRGGSVRAAAAVKMDGSHLLITVSAASSRGPGTSWDLIVNHDKLTGSQKRGE